MENSYKNDSKIVGRGVSHGKYGRVCLVVGVGVLVLLVKLAFFNTKSMVTVVGEGEMVVKAETVSVVATVSNGADLAPGLISYGESLVRAVMGAAKANGAENEEVERSMYQVAPQGGSRYVVTSVVAIDSSNITDVGKLVRDLYGAGAISVTSPSFEPVNRQETEDDLRRRAIEDAKVKARGLAEASGKRLGKIVSIGEGDLVGVMMPGESSLTEPELPTVKFSKSLSVVFEIK